MDSDADPLTGLIGPIVLDSAGINQTIASGLVPNRPPIVLDISYTTDEDSVLRIGPPGVLATTSDPDGDILWAALVTGSQHGAAVDIDPDTGEFYYDSTGVLDGLSEGQSIVDQIRYAVIDGAAAAYATIVITVHGVNDQPTARNDDGFVANIDRVLHVSAGNGVLSNDFDPDEQDQLEAIVVSGTTAKGALFALKADGSFDYDQSASADLRSAAVGHVAIPDSFSYQISDSHGGTATATVQITVTGNSYDYQVTDRHGETEMAMAQMVGIDKCPSDYYLRPVATTAKPVKIQGRKSPQVYTDDTTLVSIGPGVSMNSEGWVAFTAVHQGEKGEEYSQVYAANTQAPETPVNRLMHDFIQPPMPDTPEEESTANFGDYVQINDQNQVLATRVLRALMIYGDPVFGGVYSTVALSFLETWDAGTPGAGNTTKFRTPDMRLSLFERLMGLDRQLQAEAGPGEFGSQGVELGA